MYTPNHAMLSVVPPTGSQLIGNVDGNYMFIFDRSLRQVVCTMLENLLDEARAVSEKPPVASSETAPQVFQGHVIKGDVIFPMVPTVAIEKLSETVYVDAETVEHMEAANKRGLHKDTEPAPPPEPTEPHNDAPTLG